MDPIGRLLGNVFTLDRPEVKLAAPTNGNGKHLTPAEQKLRSTIQLAQADFWPIDAAGNVFEASSLEQDWYRVHWLVYACMRIRATKLVEAPLWVFEEEEGERAPLDDHELYALIEEPNPDQSWRDLLYATSVLLDSGGQCLWIKNQNGMQGVGSLTAFGADQFEVKANEERLYARFKVTLSGGRQEWYDAEDVVYFREHGAVAPIDALAMRLGIDMELMRGMQAGIRNSIRPGASARLPDGTASPTPDQIRELQALFASIYEGARNQGKLFVAGNMELETHEIGFAGLEAGELGKELEAAVCAAFQCPPSIVGAYVGLENSSDRANMETAERYLYDMAVIPRWRWMEGVLTKSLLRDFDEDTFRSVRFADGEVAALQQDLIEKVTIVKDTADILTVNERRGILGYEQIEGGDEPPTKPASGFGGFGGFGGAPEREEEDEPEEDEEKQRQAAAEQKAFFDERQVAWQLYHASAEAQEFGWMLAVRAELEKDRDAILALFPEEKAAEPGERKDDDDFEPADAAEVRRLIRAAEEAIEQRADAWLSAFGPLVRSTGSQAVRRAAARVGLSFDLLQPGLIQYTQKEAAWLVRQVTDTTRQSIRDALSAGLVEGESIPKLAERIREGGAFAPSRAELIARTETTRVTNGASVESLREYQREHGGKFRKSWLTARDDRVRDEHAALDGETVDLGEKFSNGLDAPGEPNCRCTLLEFMED